ncbi:TPA: DUF2972 domain-containing protein, partial [Campylobacter jejuni]|nr:DUF2972 domain-containing protein [Campylobacter jejuni]
MLNPNSAIERVKNHLAYKLGQTVIEHRHNGGGYIALFKKLYKIKKQHKKEQKIYQQIIQVFPQLKYPSLETCSDYNEALRCKFHLSYMIGEVLIKAYQNWYKGGGFKLKNNIKKANKEFQIFREILKEFKELNGEALKAIQDNKQLFLKEFPRIKNILKTHQNYQPIMNNIFHNFNYFIKNFDLIEEWLLSDDFKEKYKKENHPYPSLLDPKKLNDENEKINYHNISAELAWEMNLPLPENYEFVFWGSHGVGNIAFHTFLSTYKIKQIPCPESFDGKECFFYFFNSLMSFAFVKKYITIINYINNVDYFGGTKFYSLISLKKSVYLVRDPLSTLLTHLCTKRRGENYKTIIDFPDEIISVLKNRVSYNGKEKPSFEDIEFIITHEYKVFHDFLLKQQLKYIEDTYFIDCTQLHQKTFDNLSNKFNLVPDTQIDFSSRVSDYHFILPLYINLKKYFKINENIFIVITNCYFLENDYIDITNIFNLKTELLVAISNEYYGIFFKNINKEIIIDITKYLKKYIISIINYKILENQKRLSESELLKYFNQHIDICYQFKKILDEDHLPYIKQHRPDIVASWKYYQEFERMCKELDENNQNPS